MTAPWTWLTPALMLRCSRSFGNVCWLDNLLAALEGADAPAGLKEVESVQVLRQAWQQYYDLSKG